MKKTYGISEYYSPDAIDNCLFVGNGLNRTLGDSISWGDLLKEIARKNRVDYYDDIPMPMEFERIVNSILIKSNSRLSIEIYDTIKKEIADKMTDALLPDNAIHRQLADLPVDAILTTNYDYLLEQAFQKWYKFASKLPGNQKYVLGRTSLIDGIQFYHPHGIATYPRTICLGYEHYSGLLAKLRDAINKEEQNNGRMLIEQVLSGDRLKENTWAERFYTSNIHIIGFGMPQCEIDIWWLLTHRAYLYYTDYEGVRDRITNRIIYYDIVDDRIKHSTEDGDIKAYREKQVSQNNKYRLLKGLHVTVMPYYLSDFSFSYEAAYERIIRDIKASMKRKTEKHL